MKFTKHLKFSILRKAFENEITEERTYFALTLLTGVLSAFVAVGLQESIHYLSELFRTKEKFTPETFFWGLLLVVVSGWITTRLYPSTSGSGVPGVRVALAVYQGQIKLKATIAKFVTTIFSLSSGVSLGREGPTVAICAGVGSVLGSFFHLSKKRVKALVAVGSAGGIAAAFHTPISAVVFTLEEVVGDLNAKMLGSIVISSVVAAITAQALRGGSGAMFSQLYYSLESPYELIVYLVIGILAAVIGPIWMTSVLKFRNLYSGIFKNHRITMMVTSFIIVGLLSLIHPGVLGSGHGTLEETLLSLILDWRILLLLFTLKFFATSLCYASGISGGLFMPTLLMGATLGSFSGTLAQTFFPTISINTGALALVGMGAYFAAVIRAPFTSILIVFELTRDYNIILPLMVANIASFLISSRFTHGSIYECISEQDGIHLPSHDDNDILETLIVEDAMIQDVYTLNSELTIKEAAGVVQETSISGFPILKNGLMVGMLAKSEIGGNFAKGLVDTKLFEICEKNVVTIYPDQSLLLAFHRLKKFQVSRLPVVSRINDKRLVGIITAENIVSHFGHSIAEKPVIPLNEEQSIRSEILEFNNSPGPEE